MKHASKWLGAWACASLLVSIPLQAQSVGSSVVFPAGWAPGQAPCTQQVDTTCVPVSRFAPLPVVAGGTTYQDITVAALSSAQAAGAAQIAGINPARRLIAITPAYDGRLYIGTAASGGFFWPLYAGVTRVLSGVDCPTNALFVSGQPVGAALPMAEG